MIKAAAEKHYIDEEKIILEVLTSIKRAGADLIITYFQNSIKTFVIMNKHLNYIAYRWHIDKIEPIEHIASVNEEDLLFIDEQKALPRKI